MRSLPDSSVFWLIQCGMFAGLMWDNVQEDKEHWMERIYMPPSAVLPPSGPAGQPRMPEWELGTWDVESLRRNAGRLASGVGLRIFGAKGWRPVNKSDFKHDDFEFFQRRMPPVL